MLNAIHHFHTICLKIPPNTLHCHKFGNNFITSIIQPILQIPPSQNNPILPQPLLCPGRLTLDLEGGRAVLHSVELQEQPVKFRQVTTQRRAHACSCRVSSLLLVGETRGKRQEKAKRRDIIYLYNVILFTYSIRD